MSLHQQFAALLLTACAVSAPAATFKLPPLHESGSSEHHVGKVIWADLVTPDLKGAEHFYGAVFGWTFKPLSIDGVEYAIALSDGHAVGGLVHKALPPGELHQPAWLTFIAVSDLEASVQQAVAHGAKVIREAKNFPSRGRQAVLEDPEGAVFAMLASSSGDGEDYLAAPGEWIWSAVLAQTPATEAAFYQDVFAYDVFDLASEDSSDHLILSSGEFARASVNPFPEGSARRHAHWLNFIRVASASDTAAKVAAAGGRVLVEPHNDRHGGQVAVIADPSGAPLGVMEWTQRDSKAEPK